MGAEGYIWITKFKKNLADALQAAREETFASGRKKHSHPGNFSARMNIQPVLRKPSDLARNPVRGHCWTSSQSVKPRNSVLSAR